MKTMITSDRIDACVEILQSGGLLAVPTETVYGLAGNGLDSAAVERIYEVKGRPAVKPLSLMVPGPQSMDELCADVPPAAKALANRFWPGPLTIVLNAIEDIPSIVRAGGRTIGLRCPDHPLTLAVLNESKLPLAAPSANPSGMPSPKSAQEVLSYFDGKIDAVLDGGVCGIGMESTILSLAETPYTILRHGAVSEDEIMDALVDTMTVLGITGGSGSGKTTALHALSGMGALLIDADAVYHQLLQHDQSLQTAIEERFPGTVSNGVLERKALAAAVFSDPEALSDLNGITHPAVIRQIRRLICDEAMRGGSLVGIDAVALIGSGLDELCDRTFAVVANRELRLERIMNRDGLDRAKAEQRLNAQPSDDFFVSRCSSVLYNNSDEDSFLALCKQKFMEVMQHG